MKIKTELLTFNTDRGVGGVYTENAVDFTQSVIMRHFRFFSAVSPGLGKCKRFILKNHFKGLPKKSDFQLVEEDLPALKDGDVLFQALYLSVDPYMRPTAIKHPTGITMFGSQVARVLESKNPAYKVGDNTVGFFGWRTKTVVHPDDVLSPYGGRARPYVLPNFGDVPLSTALGVLGMPGNTAWFGLTKVCDPKPGETLVVTGAAGAVGSLVGQMGKILGLKVIGFAGSDEKVKWLTEELDFDHSFNYKTCNVKKVLKQSAPNGVDCYFDNVGGTISSDVIDSMNDFGRVAVCGSISSYNADSRPVAPVIQPAVVLKQLRIEGFLVTRWSTSWFEGIQKNLEFIKEGKLKYKESVVKGFENMDEAFIGLFHGENTGKAIIKV